MSHTCLIWPGRRPVAEIVPAPSCGATDWAVEGAAAPSRAMQAAEAAGLQVSVERFGTTSYESGQILAHRLLTRRDRPDAVFCVTDLLACGFMDEARHRFALRIPEDLCIAGYDDIPQASWSSYNLTTFTQPVALFAEDAVNWLVAQERKEERDSANAGLETAGETRSYQAEFIWRGTIRGG